MKQWSSVLRNLSLLTQFGLSLVTPVLLCLFVCYLLTSRAGAGGWVYLPGFFFGLGGSWAVAYRFFRFVSKEEKKQERSGKKSRKRGISFNEHQ